MNVKRFVIAGLVIFVAYEILTSLIKVVAFNGEYVITARLGDLVWSFLLVFIFGKGYEARGWLEGLRFGLVIGFFFCTPMILGSTPLASFADVPLSCALSPIPLDQAFAWLVLSIVKIVICGLLAAAIYRPAKTQI
jgi:hypothetical protein